MTLNLVYIFCVYTIFLNMYTFYTFSSFLLLIIIFFQYYFPLLVLNILLSALLFSFSLRNNKRLLYFLSIFCVFKFFIVVVGVKFDPDGDIRIFFNDDQYFLNLW